MSCTLKCLTVGHATSLLCKAMGCPAGPGTGLFSVPTEPGCPSECFSATLVKAPLLIKAIRNLPFASQQVQTQVLAE